MIEKSFSEILQDYYNAISNAIQLDDPIDLANSYNKAFKWGKKLIVLCPWKFAEGNSFIFWDLVATYHIAYTLNYDYIILVTNNQLGNSVISALNLIYSTVIVGNPDEVAEKLKNMSFLTNAQLKKLIKPPVAVNLPKPGKSFIGDTINHYSTEELYHSVWKEIEDKKSVKTVKIPTTLSALTNSELYAPFNFMVKDVYIQIKVFKSVFSIHEAKVLAGKAYVTVPLKNKILYVVSGEVKDYIDIITKSGANVCTRDKLKEALKFLLKGNQNNKKVISKIKKGEKNKKEKTKKTKRKSKS